MKVVRLPEELPTGWDLADPIPDGVDIDGLLEAVGQEVDSHLPTEHIAAVTRRVSDIVAEPINWLWKNRIARGKITVVAGNPGLGKSQVSLDMAARVSIGRPWPDTAYCPSGSVVILSAEDDPADTIRPRLEAAGADLDRVIILDAIRNDDGKGQRSFSIARDLEELERLLLKIGDVALVVIDPVSAYLGGTDSHKNSDVRALLDPLSKLASKHRASIVCISHLNKGGGTDALARVTGSLAFVAAARAAYIVVRDSGQPDRRLFVPAKNNLGKDQEGLAFEIVGCQTAISELYTSRVSWHEGAVAMTADEALAAAQSEGGETSVIDEATDFLREALGNGPVKTEDLKKEASSAGISWRAVQRASQKICVRKEKDGFGKDGFWQWSLT